MKFGKIFRQTVDTRMPHWRDHMIDYKALKQAIKRQAAQGTRESRPEDVAAAFTELLDRHVDTVNNFYMERIEEGVIILHALQQHCDMIMTGKARPEYRTSCQRSLVSIHFQLLLLQNYVALNFTAVTKILKKFEKKMQIPLRNDYIGALVNLPFYRCDALGELVEETERPFNLLNQPSHPVGAADTAAAVDAAMPLPLATATATRRTVAVPSSSSTYQSMPPPPPRPPTCTDPVLPASLQTGKGHAPAPKPSCLAQVS